MKRPRLNKAGVLWSGGLDSTYLIFWYLSNFPHIKVVAHYVELCNNETKTKMELAACKKLAEVFREMFPNRFEWLQNVSVEVTSVCGVNFKQLPFWLLAGTFMADTDTIAIGYVMNDDAISYLDEIQRVWKAMQFMRHTPAILEFPIAKTKKSEMTEYLPQEFKQHVVWCELPHHDGNGTFEPCGKCVSCRRSPLVPAEKEELCDIVKDMANLIDDDPRRKKKCDENDELEVAALKERYFDTPEP